LSSRCRTIALQFGPGAANNNANNYGPTMHVRAGQYLWIKLTNYLEGSTQDIGPQPVTVEHYWKMRQNPGEKIKYPFNKKAVDSPDLITVYDENMLGRRVVCFVVDIPIARNVWDITHKTTDTPKMIFIFMWMNSCWDTLSKIVIQNTSFFGRWTNHTKFPSRRWTSPAFSITLMKIPFCLPTM
jgi:hypothetical protein